MKKVLFALVFVVLVSMVLAAGIPSWDEVVAKAKKEGKVVWYGYGAEWDKMFYKSLAKEFEKEYGIKVEYVHGSWFDAIQKLIAEKKAGKKVSSFDLVFTWSVPFKQAWDAGVVWKYPIAYVVPNARNVVDAGLLEYTDMIPTHGTFLPFVWWQVAFLYNKEKVKDPPKSLDDLLDWVKKHPGRFTYSDPNKGGSGHTFLITIIEWLYGYDKYYGAECTEDVVKSWYKKSPKGYSLWEYLNELEKYMYQPGTYPAGNSAAMELFARGIVWLEPQWLDVTAEWVKEGRVDPNIVGMYIPEPTIDAGGFDGLFIPAKAPHKYAAMVLANFLLSKKVQKDLVVKRGGIYPVVKGVWEEIPESVKNQPYYVPLEEVTKNLWFRHGECMEKAMKLWVDEVVRK